MTVLSKELLSTLEQKAKEVAQRAYAPYSKLYIGAALLGESGTIYQGCNVENSSYGASNCAERSAVFHAVSLGEKKFKAMYLYSDQGFTPCGICRQVLSDFVGPDFCVYVAGKNMALRTMKISDLLPDSFFLEE